MNAEHRLLCRNLAMLLERPAAGLERGTGRE
jgi:hypothetical protein